MSEKGTKEASRGRGAGQKASRFLQRQRLPDSPLGAWFFRHPSCLVLVPVTLDHFVGGQRVDGLTVSESGATETVEAPLAAGACLREQGVCTTSTLNTRIITAA